MEKTNEITFYGTAWCGDCRRARACLDRHHIHYNYVDINLDEEAAILVEKINHGYRSVPTIIWPDGSMMVEPSTRELENKLGINTNA